MRRGEGVEWALHSCVDLARSGPDRAVSAAPALPDTLFEIDVVGRGPRALTGPRPR
ncbi:hypothetical protein [Streptomyces subrutilus]|uniref:hypothetical protein n=1 Tax=Streptomyces subrutilus TaxID=36818 RepID=UPI003402060F